MTEFFSFDLVFMRKDWGFGHKTRRREKGSKVPDSRGISSSFPLLNPPIDLVRAEEGGGRQEKSIEGFCLVDGDGSIR